MKSYTKKEKNLVRMSWAASGFRILMPTWRGCDQVCLTGLYPPFPIFLLLLAHDSFNLFYTRGVLALRAGCYFLYSPIWFLFVYVFLVVFVLPVSTMLVSVIEIYFLYCCCNECLIINLGLRGGDWGCPWFSCKMFVPLELLLVWSLMFYLTVYRCVSNWSYSDRCASMFWYVSMVVAWQPIYPIFY